MYVSAKHKNNDDNTTTRNHIVQDWELETPKDIRAGAIDDLVNAFKTSMSNLKNNNISRFHLQFRKKKYESSIVIPSTGLKLNEKGLVIYPTYCSEPIKVSRDKALRNIEFNHNCRLKNDNGNWFLYVPYKAKPENTIPKKECCALDPGTRKFQTIYSEDSIIKIGIRRDQVKRLQTRMDLLQSLRGRKLIRKSHFNEKINKIQFRMKNLVDELHYQTIRFLTTTYMVIYIPKFENQELVRINKSKKFRRDIFTLRHYTFRERLNAKGNLHNYCHVENCTEEYTSKTCTRCGNIKRDLGSSEVYKCSMCNLVLDRDVNAARNIFIKCNITPS
jgi:putative transposase